MTGASKQHEMSQAAIDARRAYKRAWNKRNPDKVRAAHIRYWEKKARQAGQDAQEVKSND